MGSVNEAESTLIFAGGEKRQIDALLDDWCQFQWLTNFRAFKKACRQGSPALVVLHISDQDSESLSKKIVEYLRLGLANRDSRIVVLVDPAYSLEPSVWKTQLEINAHLSMDEESLVFNRDVLKTEVDNYRRMADIRRQHRLEVSLLMAVAQFSESKDIFGEVLSHFSRCLNDLCSASLSVQIRIREEQGIIESFGHAHLFSEQELSLAFKLPDISHELAKAVTEKKPQVSIQIDGFDMTVINKKLNKNITGSLVFPIIAYEKVVKILVYLISTEDMDTISVNKIDLISKAFDQLKILLERNQAEKQLKKQYMRLKNTLMELNLARDQLLQKEKLASVGQLAAGIAHEVNNPLAYVISNISSIDNYVDSILQLQNLHDELLTAIDSGNDEISKTLKENIHNFFEESDMSFILSDIRSVVIDSKEGLSRVKDIITDLQSFHHYDVESSKACDINDVIERTIKLLKYELQGIHVEIEYSNQSRVLDQSNKIQKILDILIKNAIDSLKSAAKSDKTLRIKAKVTEAQLEFSVHDNGLGIEENLINKVFDPFFTTKSVDEGAGLGLSVGYNLVRQLDGDITLNTVAGEYAEFSVMVPL